MRYAALHHAVVLHHPTDVDVEGGIGEGHGEGEGRIRAPGADLGTLSQDLSDGANPGERVCVCVRVYSLNRETLPTL